MVTGIADYGNCLGIPTIGGELEFDDSYTDYTLVDVAAIGFGKRKKLIKNHADSHDSIILLGGPTGKDGIGGSQFASDSISSEDRSAVQIPDPFIEKMIIEAILEARDANTIKAMKDLGGGGLSCAISETADALDIGIEIDISRIHTRDPDMTPEEIMVSESQERMLVISDTSGSKKILQICKKFRIGCSIIGHVTKDKQMRIRKNNDILADMPAHIVANATLLDLPSRKPSYMINDTNDSISITKQTVTQDHTSALEDLLTSLNISSREWVYSQYDHEVGIRTVIKPGTDAAVLRLDNNKFLAVSIDGNPKHCYVNPKEGAIGCFEEACRNVVCTGATPIGMLDHLQFGSPRDPEVFWTFLETLKGISSFANQMGIPCIGGKVSLYNETHAGQPIKPTPVIGVLGLTKSGQNTSPKPQRPHLNDTLILVGHTRDEMGGSEYNSHILHITREGVCPRVYTKESKNNMNGVLNCIYNDTVHHTHDCSKGGLAVAVAEMCISANIGCTINIKDCPSTQNIPIDVLLFSESHSRYLLAVSPTHVQKVFGILNTAGITAYAAIGRFQGEDIKFVMNNNKGTKQIINDDDYNMTTIIELNVEKTRNKWAKKIRESPHT